MKPLFTLATLAAFITSANATTVTVTCQNFPSHFLPVTVNAVCGDTIHWTWVTGGHVVGPISASDIPSGAAMFNAPIDAGNLTFDYVVTAAGNYHYVCHPSTPHGEDGYIVVTCATGVAAIEFNPVSIAYPNPFPDKFFIETVPADRIIICNILGEKIKSLSLKNGQTKIEVDAAELNPGIYFYSIMKEGVIIETRKLVKQRQ